MDEYHNYPQTEHPDLFLCIWVLMFVQVQKQNMSEFLILFEVWAKLAQ